MKHVLFIATTPFYQEKGSTLRIFSVAKTLAQEYKVDLVTYSLGSDVDISNVLVHRTPLFFKPKIGINKPSISKVILDFFVFLKCISLLFEKNYYAIHCEDFESAVIGRFLSLFLRKTLLVYDLHNRILDNIRLAKKDIPSILEKSILFIESFVVRGCDLIVLNWNKYSADPIFSRKNTLLLYDKIDTNLSEEYDLRLNSDYIIYSGNFEPYQGIREFLDVFKNCSLNYKLVLVGNPSSDIINFINKYNLGESVMVTGRLKISQTNYLIEHALLGILPRLKDSSMKVIHYLIFNRSVIATNTISNRELLKDGYNGFLYSSPSELKAILENINNDRGVVERLDGGTEETRAFIYKNWDDSKFLERYRSIDALL